MQSPDNVGHFNNKNNIQMCQNGMNIIYMLGHRQANSVIALDSHCNQLLGRPEIMNDWGQEMSCESCSDNFC